jgi:hypothetical protein
VRHNKVDLGTVAAVVEMERPGKARRCSITYATPAEPVTVKADRLCRHRTLAQEAGADVRSRMGRAA